ncbi:hypothetical protein D9M71_644100 [compost metagenome]
MRRKDHLLAVGAHPRAAGVLEVVVLAFQVAEVGAQAQVACQQRGVFQLHAVGVGAADVGAQVGADGRVPGVGLQVVVVVVEQRDVAAQAAAGKVALEAHLVGGDVLRLKTLLGGGAGWRAVVEAAGLEASGHIAVLHQVFAPGVLQADLRAERRPGIAGLRSEVGAGDHPGGGDGVVGVVEALVLVGVAQACGQRQARGELVVALAV